MNKIEAIKKLEDILKYIDNNSRHYDGDKILCINVKRYNDYLDFNDFVKKYPKKYHKYLIDNFTQNELDNLHYLWLEYEGRYFVDGLIGLNCAYNSDEVEYQTIDLVNGDKSWGFYGRSGGWFGFNAKPLENEIDDLICEVELYDGISDNFDDVEDIIKKFDAYVFILELADKFNKGLNFIDEVTFRVDEYISDEIEPLEKDKEIKQLKKIAKKHGFVVSKLV